MTRRIDTNDQSSMSLTDKDQPIRKLNAKLSYKFMPGVRFNSNLLFCPDEEQFYVFNTTSESGRGFTCHVKKCKCRVHIRNDECYIGNTVAHNHEKKTDMYHNLLALNEMKRILHSIDNQLSQKKVFDDVVKRHPQSTLEYKTHERTLRMIRNKYAPKDIAKKKRVRLNYSSESESESELSENSDDGNIIERKAKRSAISSNVGNTGTINVAFSDQGMHLPNIPSMQNDVGPSILSANEESMVRGNGHEFSIQVASDHVLSPSTHSIGLSGAFPSSSFNSTQMPTANVANDMNFVQTSTELNYNNHTFAASFPAPFSAYNCFENNKGNHGNQLNSTASLALASQAGNHVPQTTSTANGDEFSCQVYMREADFNRFMQSGHIFINHGRFHYK